MLIASAAKRPALFTAALCLVVSTAAAQPLNVRSYGAIGNGIADDTPAFNAAIAAVPVGGAAEIYVPAGTYKLTSPLSISNKSIAFRGEGQRISNLRWDGSTDGLVFSSTTNPNKTLRISSLSFLRAGSSGGRAIAASWLATPPCNPPNCIGAFDYGMVTASITDVFIAQEPFNSGIGWDYAIDFTNATATKISNFAIHGGALNVMNDAIRYSGKSIANYVSNGDIYRTETGIGVLDTSEGFHATDVEIVDAQNGIVLWATPGSPGTSIQSCHFNTTVVGIYLIGFGDVSVSNNLIYKYGSGNWIGIHVVNGDSNRITGNYIVDFDTSISNGIVLEGSSVRNTIQGNITEGMNTGIWLVSATVNDNVVLGNLNRLFSYAGILNSGANHIISNP